MTFTVPSRFLLRSSALLLCALLLAVAVAAQTTGTISGKVADASGGVLPGTTVKVLNLDSSRETVTTTGNDGQYRITNLQAGRYRVSADSPGFAVSAETVTLETGATLTRDFSLSPGVIEDTVTVSVGKGNARLAIDTPQVVSVTTVTELEQRRPNSVVQAIERMPNIIPAFESNPARERPRMRGLDSSRVLVLIDGERLNNTRTDPNNAGISPSIVDINQIASIEAVGGADSALYGSDAMAGTIYLVTKAPERSSDGTILGFTLDGNFASNGRVRRGGPTINLSNKQIAFRGSLALFRNANYHIGGDPISLADVLNIGRFYTQFPTNAAGTTFNSAANFPIFSVPADGEILNGQAHGSNTQLDLWFYPTEKHSLRGRFLDSRHDSLGNAFSGPPYDTQERFNSFRNFTKTGIRYEGIELARFVPRLSINYSRQRLTFPQDQYDYSIIAGSSAANATTFTGNPSRFNLNTFTSTKNRVDTDNFEAQVILAPSRNLQVITGYNYINDDSKDEFTRFSIANQVTREPNLATIVRGTTTPDTRYRDDAYFAQAELKFRRIYLSGGVRFDRWQTTAKVTPGFPVGSELAVLTAAMPGVIANPGILSQQVASFPRLLALTAGQSPVKTSRLSTTGNFGVILRLPGGLNPYARYANSYREPSITERYLIRNFPAFPGLIALVAGNPDLKPETGRNYDFGVKFQRKKVNASLGYFRNNLRDFIVFQTPPFGNNCVAANPAAGLLPLSANFAMAAGCPVGQSAISFNGRVNQARSVIQGIEGTAEVTLSLGGMGSLNPYTSFGFLRGENQSPSDNQITVINRLYNRSDTPIRLEGSANDVPLGNITPFRSFNGIYYTDSRGRIFAEYLLRRQNAVRRANPSSFVGTTLINIGTFRSLAAFNKQTIRGGYNWRRDRYRMSFTVGIDNLTNLLYWEHFQPSPAPGRSFIFGFTTEFFNLLKR